VGGLRKRDAARLWVLIAGLIVSGLAGIGYTVTADQESAIGLIVALVGPLIVNAVAAQLTRRDVYSQETVEELSTSRPRPIWEEPWSLPGRAGSRHPPEQPLSREGPRADNPPDPGEERPSEAAEHDDPR